MLSGVGIVCFAGSYTVALILELTRLLFRSAIRGAIMVGFAGAGLFAHTAYLYHRAVSAQGIPLSNWQDWYLLAAWLLAAVYLYLTYFHPKTSFGLFLLPLVLALLAIAAFWADSRDFARETASLRWGFIHGISILLAAVAVLVEFVAGLMYLRQAWRLKHKRPLGDRLRLPSLEWLHRLGTRSMLVATLMLGIGVLAGAMLVFVRGPGAEGRLAWTDPFIVSTLAMFVWLAGSIIFAALYKPLRQGPKMAYLTVVSFVLLVTVLCVGLLAKREHGGARFHKAKDAQSAVFRLGGYS
jgi:ABC-type transport system involved in cytochrome c biogenesis permease subunit